MKILMVCTFAHGGAAIAARRQKEALRMAGIECSLVSIRENPTRTTSSTMRNGDEIFIDVPASAWSYSGRITSAYCANNRSPLSNTWFSFWPCQTFFEEELLKVCLDYEVIHFHWISQMVSSWLLSKLRLHKRRIVITGHDMNHFTGGCHYSAGCLKFKEACESCPQLLTDPLDLVKYSYLAKLESFSNISATWIFPSIWLANLFRASRLFDKEKPESCKVLYNCINTDRFVYLPESIRQEKRNLLGFSDDDLIYVAGAADNSELRKGFDYIESSIKNLSKVLKNRQYSRKCCIVVTFGRGNPDLTLHTPYIKHLHLGQINEEKVTELLQIADLLIFPSIEENFSNLILESLMCGCPVLAFRIGGVPDVVIDGKNGWIVDQISHEQFSEKLASTVRAETLKEMRDSTQKWRDQFHKKYSYNQIANELIAVYKNTADVTRTTRTASFSREEKSSKAQYVALFSRVAANDTNSHRMLANNLRQHVELSINNEVELQTSSIRSIPTIYIGFTDMVHYEPLGRVSWLLKTGHVIFKPPKNSTPAFLIAVPNHDWVPHLVDSALTKLSTSINGIPASVTSVKPNQHVGSFYILVTFKPETIRFDSYNTLSLIFSEASVPESQDLRGMAVLCSSFTLIDLGFIDSSTTPSYATLSALALQAEQSHYLWEEWSDETNASASLGNDLETWIDLLGSQDPVDGSLA